MNSLSLLFNFMIVLPYIIFAENTMHADEKLLREIVPETSIEPVIMQLQRINCDARGLKAFLKEELIESERKLTENSDEKLRERYKYHEKILLPEERSEIFSLAQKGTTRILQRFKTKWANISNNLASD